MRRFSALVRYVPMCCDRMMRIVCVIRVVSCRVVLICVVSVTLRYVSCGLVRFGSVWFYESCRVGSCWIGSFIRRSA